jgi:hypothetical protein
MVPEDKRQICARPGRAETIGHPDVHRASVCPDPATDTVIAIRRHIVRTALAGYALHAAIIQFVVVDLDSRALLRRRRNGYGEGECLGIRLILPGRRGA